MGFRGWQGVTSWSVFYLMQEKGVLDVGAAATRVAGLELGGLLGSLVAGRLSDWLITRNSKGGAVGQRVRVGAPACGFQGPFSSPVGF